MPLNFFNSLAHLTTSSLGQNNESLSHKEMSKLEKRLADQVSSGLDRFSDVNYLFLFEKIIFLFFS